MRLTLTRPDDWHLHLRDDDAMASVVAHSAKRFARAIVMPNLKPPVTTTDMAAAYRRRILEALPAGTDFEPLMTLYLTDRLTPDEIIRARESGIVKGIKLYPAGATTNSDSGVTDIRKRYSVFETMEREDLPLLVHAEVTDPEVDIFDRERAFIDRTIISVNLSIGEGQLKSAVVSVSAAVGRSSSEATIASNCYSRRKIFENAPRHISKRRENDF